ncbi:hypothetical protein [Polaromonas sp.]|uniref:phage adaptor protein n=1 Tax=Polaromonas sp. TaxID=1869339 RepID=UPI00326706DB
MTLAELIAQFRTDADDKEAPYLSEDEDVTLWLNEAEDEAAIRASLIHEASNADICEIDVTAGTSVYPLHAAVIYVTNAWFTPAGSTNEIPLDLTDRIEQDRVRPGWRRLTNVPCGAIQNDTTIQLTCLPNTDGLLRIECYRLPLQPMVLAESDDTYPEIGAIHHRHLVYWALQRCYRRPDAELLNESAAERAEALFVAHFGLSVDADMRRSFQANRPLFNKAVW